MAIEDIEGLLGSPLFMGGLGLLAGTFDDNFSTGETIGLGFQGAQQGLQFEAQRQENEARRRQLQQEAQQRRAQQDLVSGLLVPPTPEAGTGQRAGLDQQEMLGLLAQADPQGFTQAVQQGVLGDMFGEQLDPTNQQQNLAAAIESGLIDMSTPEGRDRAARFLLNEDDPNGIALEQQRAAIEAQQALLEAQKEQLSLQGTELAIDESLDTGFRDLVDLSRINSRLEDTLAETGGITQGVVETLATLDRFTPEAVLGVVRNFTGTDISLEQAKKLASDLQTFRNKSTESLSRSLVKLAEHNVNPTDNKVNVLAETMPSTQNFPNANDRIILDKLETLKKAAEFRGKWKSHPLKNDVEKEIKKMRRRLGLAEDTLTTINPDVPKRGIVELPGNSSLQFRSE